MPFHHFPNEFVYWQDLENHKEIKDKLLPIILEKNEKIKNNPFDCVFNTSFFKEQKRSRIENQFLHDSEVVHSVILKTIEKMTLEYNALNMYKLDSESFVIYGGWWNFYKENEYQEYHTHVAEPILNGECVYYPCFSVVYILHDESEENALSFRKPAPLPLMPPYEDYVFQTSNEKTIKEGTILVFPYNLGHVVKPCTKPGRITISYNVYSSWGNITS